MPSATIQDAIVQRLRAAAGVTALVPAGNIWHAELAIEDRLPTLVVQVDVEDYEPIIPGSRLEKLRVKLTARAQAAPPAGQGQPRPTNPAEAIVRAACAALDWSDVIEDVPGYVPAHCWEEARVRSKAERRLSPDAERVWRSVGVYELEVGHEYA